MRQMKINKWDGHCFSGCFSSKCSLWSQLHRNQRSWQRAAFGWRHSSLLWKLLRLWVPRIDPYLHPEFSSLKNVFRCGGGWPIRAMEYWQKNGVVTGGEYGDSRTCSPYTIGPQDDHPSTPRCVQLCRQGYPRSWAADKHYGIAAY